MFVSYIWLIGSHTSRTSIIVKPFRGHGVLKLFKIPNIAPAFYFFINGSILLHGMPSFWFMRSPLVKANYLLLSPFEPFSRA